MKAYRLICFAFILSSVIGCNVNVVDTQIINIEHYADNKKNVKLSEDLIYYDPSYIAYKIPAYNEDTAKGISISHFVRSSDGKPSYRITYSLKVPSVAKNHTELKKGFDDFIPKLASSHAAKESLFKKLEPTGMEWAKSLSMNFDSKLFNESSTIFKESATLKMVQNASSQIVNKYGKPSEISFVRAQYYEAFDDVPESVSLFYSAIYKDQREAMFRVSMNQENQEWLVLGFRFDQM